jgi:hypothetical protein
MATAFYPLGMRTTSSMSKAYQSPKGREGNPMGTVPQNIRPLTNKDYGNVVTGGWEGGKIGFGLPRPIHHVRKGRNVNAFLPPIDTTGLSPEGALFAKQVDYNMNRRAIRSSTQGALVHDTMDIPGGVQSLVGLGPEASGILWTSNYKPNPSYVSNNPTPQTQTQTWCCNEERKARRRSRYASTNISPTYYSSHAQYMKNRCATYDQRAYNFTEESNRKPGGPTMFDTEYQANCYPNAATTQSSESQLIERALAWFQEAELDTTDMPKTSLKEMDEWIENLAYLNIVSSHPLVPEDYKNLWTKFLSNPYVGMPAAGPTSMTCKKVIYKPNNYQYATQGAVESSNYHLRKKINTLTVNTNSLYPVQRGGPNTTQVAVGEDPRYINLLKNKSYVNQKGANPNPLNQNKLNCTLCSVNPPPPPPPENPCVTICIK